MKRREFLLSSLGATAGLTLGMRALAQTEPCPVPSLQLDGGQPVATACAQTTPPSGAQTAIEAIAASLAPGMHSTALGDSGLSNAALFTVQWCNRFFYDHERGRAHMLGKNASSQGAERSHCLYDANSNTWSYSVYGGNETGHIYESFAYDHKEGVPYYGQWSGQPSAIRFWQNGTALNNWSSTSTSLWNFSSTNAVNPVLCWHPDLFGHDDGGLLAIRLISGTRVELVAWRRANNSWTAVPGSETNASGGSPQYGAMVYVRAAGHVVVTFATGNTFTVGAGSNGKPARPNQIANPPIRCQSTGANGNIGILIEDPAGSSSPYILEKGGSNRVWRLSNGQWQKRSYTHPLPTGSATRDTNWVVASMAPLGVFWAQDNRQNTPSVVWRPAG